MMKTRLISLPRKEDPRGNLTFMEYGNQIPFEIARVFWTYDVPGGQIRGGHAYKTNKEVIIALSGSLDVVITHPNGEEERQHLNRSYTGLFVPAGLWRHLENFSTNSVALTIASQEFSPVDYIRDIVEYKNSVLNV